LSDLRVLFIGEIVGKAGVFCVKNMLPRLKEEHNIDFVVADGEGATGGFGLGKNHSIYLHKLGIDVITSGERIYYKKDMVSHITKAPYILRPVNYPRDDPGYGWKVYEKEGKSIAVINVLGISGFGRVHLENPLLFLPELIGHILKKTQLILIDFHAATTAEKSTLFYFLDGKVSAIIGTHMRALTADERVMPGGTAVITDAGRTGSINSVGGLDSEIEIRKLITQVHEYSKDTWGDVELQGVIVDIKENGKASSIKRLRIEYREDNND